MKYVFLPTWTILIRPWLTMSSGHCFDRRKRSRRSEEHVTCIMRAIWKGTISFGLVSIPVSLYPAIRREELQFRLLRGTDLSPVNYKRVAEKDGREVPWDKIVKGYEYQKDRFVVIKDEDFKRVDIEATQTVDILNFISLEEVDPLLFYKPYHLEVGKGGGKAYMLLRDALNESQKIAVARVVIKTRQHLAAIKSQGKNLVLELMYFPDELLDSSTVKAPEGRAPTKAEIAMAEKLIENMTVPWNPDDYKDEYKEALEEMIEEKVKRGAGKAVKPTRAKRPTNVIDLVAVLQESLKKSQSKSHSSTKAVKKTTSKKSSASKKTRSRRKAA
jgi:DNA end-binding protein Ku